MKGRFPQRVRLDTMGEPDFGAACALEPNATEACCIAALRGSCLLDLIGTASAAHRDRAAFYGGVGEDGLEALSYAALLAFSATIGDALYPGAARRCEGPARLATVVRNSAASAVAFVSLTRCWTLAPLSAAISRAELAFELDDLPAAAVLLDDAVARAWTRSECDARAIPARPRRVSNGGGPRPRRPKKKKRKKKNRSSRSGRTAGASARSRTGPRTRRARRGSGRRAGTSSARRSSCTRPGRRPSRSSCR